MAWDEYHGQHRVRVKPEGKNCLALSIHKKGSSWPNHFASVCQDADGLWRYSGHASRGRAIYGDFPTAKGAIKAAIRSNRTWIGVRSTMHGARKRRKRRRL